MEKEFIPYDRALRLKNLGFDEPCFGYYDNQIKNLDTISSEVCERLCKHDTHTKAPTFSQAFRWFREEYRMFHEVFIDTEPTIENPNKLEFSYLILHMVGAEHMYVDKEKSKRFNTYEEAELSCLDRIIEVIEEKQIKPYEDVIG